MGDNNVVRSGEALKVRLNEPVTLIATGAGLDYNTRALNCWATMTPTNYKIQYDLLKDGCVKEPSLVLMKDGGDHKLTFSSFAFSTNTNAPVYLHCDLVACSKDDPSCAECNTSRGLAGVPDFGERKRRSAVKQ